MTLHCSLVSVVTEKHTAFNFEDEVQSPNLKMKGIMPVQCTRQHTIVSHLKPKIQYGHI